MNNVLILCLVLLAVYAAANFTLSAFVVVLWRTRLEKTRLRAKDILIVRCLPAVGAALLSVSVAFPAFLDQEPVHATEGSGPLIWGLAIMTCVIVGDALRRGWRALQATEGFLKRFDRVQRWIDVEGRQIGILNTAAPWVAVIGAARPQIIAASTVISACTADELRQVIAHEIAHLSSRDNLKFLLLVVSPDVLAWLPIHSVLMNRWRMAVEFEADQRATGLDRRKRVALASALIKIARLSVAVRQESTVLSMPVAADHIEARVRNLLAPVPDPASAGLLRWLGLGALLLPLVAIPFYYDLQCYVEVMVSFGR